MTHSLGGKLEPYGSEGDRTLGLVIANDALYQTELPTQFSLNLLYQIIQIRLGAGAVSIIILLEKRPDPVQIYILQ